MRNPACLQYHACLKDAAIRNLKSFDCLNCDKAMPEIIEESEEKMETIEKKKKGKHKKCLNHPDKIAWRNGLCYKCNKEILHNKCKDSDMLPDEVEKVDEGIIDELIKSMPIVTWNKEAKKEEPVAVKKYEVWEVEEDGYKASIYISPDYRFIESVLVGLPDEYDYKSWMFLGKVSREIERLAKG